MALKSKADIEKYSYQNPIMIYDGVCNFCNHAVQFILRYETTDEIRFLPYQSDAGRDLLKIQGKSEDEIDSVIMIKNGQYLFESDVTVMTLPYLSKPFKLLLWIKWIPKKIRNFFYRLIANNRYLLLGKSDVCQIPTKTQMHRFLHL